MGKLFLVDLHVPLQHSRRAPYLTATDRAGCDKRCGLLLLWSKLANRIVPIILRFKLMKMALSNFHFLVTAE